jgi:hypothetical protein
VNGIVEHFKTLVKFSSRTVKLINAYQKLKDNPAENAYLMEKKLADISKISEGLPDCEAGNDLKEWLKGEKDETEKAKDDFRFNFGEKLKAQFSSDNWQLRGQYPILRARLYTIKIDFEFGEAAIFFGPEVEKIKSKIPLEAQAIHSAVKRFDSELKAVKFDAREFYRALFAAYKKKLMLAGRNVGEKLPLTEVLSEYVISGQPAHFHLDPRRENFRGFSRTQLSYLLFQLNKASLSDTAMRLYTATLDATTDRKQSIWIPGNDEGEGTYYSYISFEKGG